MEMESDTSLLWERRCADLSAWKAIHGNCNVPKAEGKLGRWVVRQRELYKKGKLEPDRRTQLDTLGFVWNTNEAAWEHRYALLLQYGRINGHCCVPISDPTLGMWVAKMRANRRKGKLPLHRIQKLDAIGFIWNTAEADWMDKFDKLLRFRAKEGHSCVPFNEGELGWWVNTQRQCKRKGKLSAHRMNLLDQAGFVWNPTPFLQARRRLNARIRTAAKRSREEESSPSYRAKRQKLLSPPREKPLFTTTESIATTSTNKSCINISRIQETPTSILPVLTPKTEPSVTGTISSGSEQGAARSCSIASLLSPCPSPSLAVPVRLPMHRKLEFSEELSTPPAFNSGYHSHHSNRLQHRQAPNFVLPPISSLRDLTNISHL